LQDTLNYGSVTRDVLPHDAEGLHCAFEELGPAPYDLEICDTALFYPYLPLLVSFDSSKASKGIVSVLLVGARLGYVLEELDVPVEEFEDASIVSMIFFIQGPVDVPPFLYLHQFVLICSADALEEQALELGHPEERH
jgi:hypothetical protein